MTTEPTPEAMAKTLKLFPCLCGLDRFVGNVGFIPLADHSSTCPAHMRKIVALALDAERQAVQWARDREWDALMLRIFRGVEAESSDPAPNADRLRGLRVACELAVWEEAAQDMDAECRHAFPEHWKDPNWFCDNPVHQYAKTFRARAAQDGGTS